jgi:hypothetical protein
MFDAAVVTAIYDSYDDLKPVCPQDGLAVDWVVVTDDPHLAAPGWRVVCEPQPGVAPMRAAKAPKFRPWDYTTAPASVWIDGSCQVTSAGFVAAFLGRAEPLAGFTHRYRDCLYAEAEISAPLLKFAGEPIREQAAYYREMGHPEHWGLWETTVIGRRHTPAMHDLGEAWAAETAKWSTQDQVSYPYILRNLGLRPVWVRGHQGGSPWHAFAGSDRHQTG